MQRKHKCKGKTDSKAFQISQKNIKIMWVSVDLIRTSESQNFSSGPHHRKRKIFIRYVLNGKIEDACGLIKLQSESMRLVHHLVFNHSLKLIQPWHSICLPAATRSTGYSAYPEVVSPSQYFCNQWSLRVESGWTINRNQMGNWLRWKEWRWTGKSGKRRKARKMELTCQA